MKLPPLTPCPRTRELTETFRGYRNRSRLRPGELAFTENLSTRDFPLLSTRKRRGMVCRLGEPQGLLAKDKLCWVDGGTLYCGGEATPVTDLAPGRKQLVSMGATVCIFPDKVYYNTADPTDWGSMEFSRSLSVPVRYAHCDRSGAERNVTASESPPEGPANGAAWYDTAGRSLKLYSAAQGEWLEEAAPCAKLSFEGLDFALTDYLREGDGLRLSGTAYPELLDGDRVICALGADYLVVEALLDEREPPAGAAAVRLSRELPALDYVCECRNRLWGCFYGLGEDGRVRNEICCSALGDFKNWRQYRGLSTDSWSASVGSDGPWTGAVNYLGSPIFFKEDRIHRVTVSPSGAHSVQELRARGVQRGSAESLAVADGLLFYKSPDGVAVYQGGFPEDVGEALGETRYRDAAGGSLGSSYYLSMRDGEGRWSLFVYDAANKLWCREDDLQLTALARLNDSLYALDASGVIWDLAGLAGERETRLPWTAQTGLLYCRQPGRKAVSRYELLLSSPGSAEAEISLRYDSDGIWHPAGRIRIRGRRTVTVPVRPRPCGHLELRLKGEGEICLSALAAVIDRDGEEE